MTNFKPQNRRTPSITKYIRVSPDDWEKIEQLAKEIGETPAEIARQAINHALKEK